MVKTAESSNDMPSQWYQLTIQIPPKVKDVFSERLFELGVEGINENLDHPNVLQAYVEAELKDLVVKKIEECWIEFQTQFPKFEKLQIQIDAVPDENWAESYKKYYYAQKLTDLFFLRPKWDLETPIPSGMIPIFMDPGQAFGTGLHPSTRLCLKTIQSQILEHLKRNQLRCLDVGTGTGILALAAFHLGVHQVVGIDNDPVAVEVAKENMQLNQVEQIDLSTEDIRKLQPSFDFVISNILLETHRELAKEYARLLPPGGLLLLSGLLGHQKKELFDFILPLGFTLLECKNFQEWASFLFVRRDE
jgi:ribosomal protein L11 methyltransferase